jgi:hypothetical protein
MAEADAAGRRGKEARGVFSYRWEAGAEVNGRRFHFSVAVAELNARRRREGREKVAATPAAKGGGGAHSNNSARLNLGR